ncbi:hypothetical protein LDENG_00192050 [Lucifuga dentata]|nr:hypothetical protein LDENG_00192050 [Lucifuga dentata]
MAAQFRPSSTQELSSRPEKQAPEPREVLCDMCIGTKLKAIKSCLKCEASFCQTHLEPHRTVARLKSHQLIDPVENLEDRICTKHDKPLELFCKTDQAYVCLICLVFDHKNHDFITVKEEYEGKKAELGTKEAEIQQMTQQRRLKIQQIKQSAKLSREAADVEKADGVHVFTALKQFVEKIQAEFIKTIKEKQKSTEKDAEDLIKDLEQEISALMQKAAEVEQLSRSEDHLHFLQSFPSISNFPPTKDWTKVRVHQRSYEGNGVKVVTQLKEKLRTEMEKMELQRVQQFAVDVILDPDTAHPELILSEDRKQVHHGDLRKNLPDNSRRFSDYDVRKNLPDDPKRFSYCTCVLGEQSFSSGRFYYEVQVKGKTGWDLGVARESITRKGNITLKPEDGYWTIWLRNENEYFACADPVVHLCLHSKPEKVGVFVDYEEGLVSFYDVDAAALIYSFTGCCFTEKLLPYFSPFKSYDDTNFIPLIISAVSHSEEINEETVHVE